MKTTGDVNTDKLPIPEKFFALIFHAFRHEDRADTIPLADSSSGFGGSGLQDEIVQRESYFFSEQSKFIHPDIAPPAVHQPASPVWRNAGAVFGGRRETEFTENRKAS
ncbi:MAG: hypothetical protein H7A52_17020 [Akkermansiaceae bacterium]|nr:hypothetical protein [Akkermansiaceae bacterium]